MNHSGSRSAPFCPAGAFGPVVMSNWNAWTSERPAERENDAAAQWLGDPAGAFAHLAGDDVVLLEIGVRGVQHERLAPSKLVPKKAFEARVPALGETRCDLDASPLAWIEVDVEVLGLEHLKVESSVLNLVLAEVLRRGVERRRQHAQDRADQDDRAASHSDRHDGTPRTRTRNPRHSPVDCWRCNSCTSTVAFASAFLGRTYPARFLQGVLSKRHRNFAHTRSAYTTGDGRSITSHAHQPIKDNRLDGGSASRLRAVACAGTD